MFLFRLVFEVFLIINLIFKLSSIFLSFFNFSLILLLLLTYLVINHSHIKIKLIGKLLRFLQFPVLSFKNLSSLLLVNISTINTLFQLPKFITILDNFSFSDFIYDFLFLKQCHFSLDTFQFRLHIIILNLLFFFLLLFLLFFHLNLNFSNSLS